LRAEKWYLAYRFVNSAKACGFSLGNSFYNQIEEREIPLEAKTEKSALAEVAEKNLITQAFANADPRLICELSYQIPVKKAAKKARFG
jgi:hypothetical protein